MADLLDKRFVVVAGMGGVGRTTVSLVVGRLAAARGRRTLICLCNVPSGRTELLGDEKVDFTIRTVSEHLDVVNLDSRSSQEEYGRRMVRNRTVHRLVFGSRVVRRFLDAVPGLADWALLGKATFHAMEKIGHSPRYDMVVFDSPAHGHGLDTLALPRAIVSSVPSGQMREEARARCELMENAALSEVIPVTLPEETTVNDTMGFVSELEAFGLSVRRIVVNMVTADSVSAELNSHVEAAKEKDDSPSWLVPPAVAVFRHKIQAESIAKLASVGHVKPVLLPLIEGNMAEAKSQQRLEKAFLKTLASK